MDGTDIIQNRASHLCEEDSAPPSPKRSKTDKTTTNYLFITKECLENYSATQSVFLASPAEVPDGSYSNRSLSPQNTFQECEAHGVEDIVREGVRFSGFKPGYIDTNEAIERNPGKELEQPSLALLLTASELTSKGEVAHQKLESNNQNCLNERGMPYLSHHQNNTGGTLKAGYSLNSITTETPSANTFAMLRNSLEQSPALDMPTNEAEHGINPLETFAGIEKNELQNEENKVQVNDRSHNESFAVDVVEYADISAVTNVTLSKNLESNDDENSADLMLGFPSGATWDHAFFTSTAQTSFAYSKHTIGKRPGSETQELPDVVDVAAVIESHMCCEADKMRMVQVKHITSECGLPMVEVRSDTTAEKTSSDGLGQCSSAETDTEDFHKGDVQTVQEEAREEQVRDHDKILEESIRLVPSSEVIPVISRPTDTTMEFPCEAQVIRNSETGIEKGQTGVNLQTSQEFTEQQCCAKEKPEKYEDKRFQLEEHDCKSVFGTAENWHSIDSAYVNSDIACLRCTLSDPKMYVPTYTDYHLRTADTISPLSTNSLVNIQAEETNSNFTVDNLPVDPTKVEQKEDGKGTTVAAGWSDAATKKDICEGKQGPPCSLPPQAIFRHKRVTENILASRRSDTTQMLEDERDFTVANPACDAVVPESDSSQGDDKTEASVETKALSNVHFQSDCALAVFDSFEKFPLCLSADEIEQSPLLNNSPCNPIRGRSQSCYDVTGPASEIIPMQIPCPPNADLSKNNKQVAEREYNVEHSSFQKGRAQDCNSDILKAGPGASLGDCQNTSLRVRKQIPDDFSQCPAARYPGQSDQLPVTFGASPSFSIFSEPKLDPFDKQGRSGTGPPADVRPPNSDLNLESCENNDKTQFRMKERFDLVLEELGLFFSIGKENEKPSRQNSEPLYSREGPTVEGSAEWDTGHLSSPAVKAQGMIDTEQNVYNNIGAVRGQPETTRTNVGFDCEQEVPFELGHSSRDGEDSMYYNVRQKGCIVTEAGSKHWSPAFVVLPFQNELNRRFLELPRRLEPLRTCVRPIRVGLSKKAKPKQLHPYFK